MEAPPGPMRKPWLMDWVRTSAVCDISACGGDGWWWWNNKIDMTVESDEDDGRD